MLKQLEDAAKANDFLNFEIEKLRYVIQKKDEEIKDKDNDREILSELYDKEIIDEEGNNVNQNMNYSMN